MPPHPDEARRKGLAYATATDLRNRANLEKGRRKRDLNRLVRRLVREGEIDGVRLLTGTLDETNPAHVEAMQAAKDWPLGKAVRLVRGVGEAKGFEIIVTLQATPTTKLGDLSWSRRAELGRLVKLVVGANGKPKKKKNDEEVQHG